MPHLIDPSTLRIFHPNGKTVGTGFLVAPNLAVTCAHVVVAANALDGDTIQIQFSGSTEHLTAFVDPQLWRATDQGDVAFLRLDAVPAGIMPLHLGLAAHSQSGNPFYAFGYATAAEKQGIGARGNIITLLPDQSYLQIRAHEAQHGMSGGPVFDEQRGVVVGMITQGHTAQGRNAETTFATPTELLFAICPELCPAETCPYRGLENFTAETARFFFGREALTEKLVATLRGGCRFLAVLGPSGSGKSSVVRAGLLPKLAKGLFADWRQVVMRPTDDPFKQLKAAGLESLDDESERVILFVDQFEELFTLCPDDQRTDFVAALTTALENSRFMLLLSMRDDFYSAFHAQAAALAQSEQLKIENVPGLLKADELTAMIERPAAVVGLALDEGLTAHILQDLTRAGEARSSILPLLEFALTQLWKQRCDGWLTHAAYQAIGGVTGSLARWAEEAYSDLPKAERSLAESLLTSLVHPGDELQGLPDTRRQRALEEFDPIALRVVKHFADRRLLATGGETVELVHDALLREWERLRGWLNDDRDNLRLREGVSDDARRWDNADRDESLLNHRGARLELALVMSKNPRYRLNPVEQAYLDGCVRLREKEKAAAAKRRKYTIAGISAALCVILMILVGWGWTNSENSKQLSYQVATSDAAEATAIGEANIRATAQAKAELQAKFSRSGELAVLAQSLSLDDGISVLRSTLLAVESDQLRANLQADQIFRHYLTLAALPVARMIHSSYVSSVAFSPDGKYVASGSNDGTVQVLEVKSGYEIARLINGDNAHSIAFSPDGKYLVSGSWDGTARVWEIESGHEVARMTHGNYVHSVAFSSNGKYVVSGSYDGQHECGTL